MTSSKRYALFERFEIEMTWEQAVSASHPGSCDEDVKVLVSELSEQLDKLHPAQIVAELSEYGAWEPGECLDHDTNIERIVWIAACNIHAEEDSARDL